MSGRSLPRVVVAGALGAVLVVVLVVVLVLWRTAGEDDPFGDYCSAVEERRDDVGAALADGPQTGLLRALPLFEELAEKAPDDISDEWEVVIASITQLRDALDAAGIEPAAYDPDRPPADLAAADKEAIDAAAIRLAGRETQGAFAGVDQQARDVCKTPLFL